MNFRLYKFFLEWCSIITYSVIMGIYACSKPFQFEDRLKIAIPVNELNGFRLMWAFYGYSTSYPIIIGCFQLIGIILLFPKKTRILGCILSTIILSNIIIQDIIYNVPIPALIVALFLQLLIFIIILFNKEKLLETLSVLISKKDSVKIEGNFINKLKHFILSVLTIAVIIFILEVISKHFI